MKTSFKFYTKNTTYHLRSSRMLGRRRKTKCFSYSTACCQIFSLEISTQPPQTLATLRIKILADKGIHTLCKFHSFTDIILYNRPRPKTERKFFTEVDLNSPTGTSLVTIALHKPYACPCRTFITFSVRRSNNTVINKSTRIFRIVS
jgi:hypothetical protein